MARIDDYRAARALVQKELAQADPREVARRSWAAYEERHGEAGLVLPYFGRAHWIRWPDLRVDYLEGEGEVNIQEQILMLHYLHQTKGDPVTGMAIDFRQVPAGQFYYSAFVGRAKTPLLKVFGHNLELYRRVAGAMGGRLTAHGDLAMTYQALPLVPITHVLFGGDAEFPPDANILFDQSIVTHLPTEDIAALAGMSVYRLMGMARKMSS